jgi:hypothetical protein
MVYIIALSANMAPLPAVKFQRHIGQHLEELALFLLPRTESDSDEGEGKEEEENEDQATEIRESERKGNYPHRFSLN